MPRPIASDNTTVTFCLGFGSIVQNRQSQSCRGQQQSRKYDQGNPGVSLSIQFVHGIPSRHWWQEKAGMARRLHGEERQNRRVQTNPTFQDIGTLEVGDDQK